VANIGAVVLSAFVLPVFFAAESRQYTVAFGAILALHTVSALVGVAALPALCERVGELLVAIIGCGFSTLGLISTGLALGAFGFQFSDAVAWRICAVSLAVPAGLGAGLSQTAFATCQTFFGRSRERGTILAIFIVPVALAKTVAPILVSRAAAHSQYATARVFIVTAAFSALGALLASLASVPNQTHVTYRQLRRAARLRRALGGAVSSAPVAAVRTRRRDLELAFARYLTLESADTLDVSSGASSARRVW
jgi:MFS family permease